MRTVSHVYPSPNRVPSFHIHAHASHAPVRSSFRPSLLPQFASFDADGSGELELKELKPFFKALQNSAFAAEAEGARLKDMAVACRTRANWMREAGATMGQLERLKQDHDEQVAAISLPVKLVTAIGSRPSQQRVKPEEVAEKIFGCLAKTKAPTVPREGFTSGVLAGIGMKPSAAGQALLDEINAWFDSARAHATHTSQSDAQVDLYAHRWTVLNEGKGGGQGCRACAHAWMPGASCSALVARCHAL